MTRRNANEPSTAVVSRGCRKNDGNSRIARVREDSGDNSLQEFLTAMEYIPASVDARDGMTKTESVVESVVPFFFHTYDVIMPPVPLALMRNSFPAQIVVSFENDKVAIGLAMIDTLAEADVIGVPQYPVTVQVYVPASSVCKEEKLKFARLELGIGFPFLFH